MEEMCGGAEIDNGMHKGWVRSGARKVQWIQKREHITREFGTQFRADVLIKAHVNC
jgi:hypothetical protein